MHELSLVNSMLDIVDEYAAREKFSVVKSLRLSAGKLSCIDRASLEFAFQVQSQGTRAEGACLILEMLPVVMYCFSCGMETRQDRLADVCPACGSSQIALNGGTEELQLVEMEVE